MLLFMLLLLLMFIVVNFLIELDFIIFDLTRRYDRIPFMYICNKILTNIKNLLIIINYQFNLNI